MAQAHARETALQNDALLAENEDLKGRQTERMAMYRDRLAKYDFRLLLCMHSTLHS